MGITTSGDNPSCHRERQPAPAPQLSPSLAGRCSCFRDPLATPTTGTAARPRLRRGAHLQASPESRSPRGSGASVLNTFGERRVLQRDVARGHGQRGPSKPQETLGPPGGGPSCRNQEDTATRSAPGGGPTPALGLGCLLETPHVVESWPGSPGSCMPQACSSQGPVLKPRDLGSDLPDRPGDDKPDSWASDR